MSRIAVLGDPDRVGPWGLAGAVVVPASDAAAAVRAWDELADDIEVVIVTAPAAEALGSRLSARLTVVLP